MDRDWRPDVLKAAAIFGVVFVHTPGAAADPQLFRFCVPVFIGLWAAYYDHGLARRPGREEAYVRARFVQLLVPYLFWTVVYLALLRPWDEWRATPVREIVGGWFGGYAWAGQYYFVIVLQLALVLPLVRPWVNRWTVVAALAAGLAVPLAIWAGAWRVPPLDKLNERPFVFWLPFAAAGVGAARGYLPRPPGWLAVAAAAAALAVSRAEYEWVAAHTPAVSAYLLVSVAAAAAALLLAAVPRGRPAGGPAAPVPPGPWPARVVGYVGRHTFPVFVANPLVISLLRPEWLAPAADPVLTEARHTAVVLGVIAACLALGWALRRVGLGRLVGD